jgi:hypothetical protein
MFLSGFFQTPPQNFFNAEKVDLDIMRDDEDVAIAVEDISVSPRMNAATQYTNKAFTPPIFKEAGVITAWDTIKRQPGQDPFVDPDFNANATLQAFKIFRRLENKLRRAVELMCSQVLTTGTVTCVDATGAQLYVLNYVPKSTHISTVSNAWNGGSADPLSDLTAFTSTIRTDGRAMPTKAIFGATAWQDFLGNAKVQSQINRFGLQLGQLNPVPAPDTRGIGATFQGYLWVGNYKIEAWTYDGWYRDPQTGNHLPYVPATKVIVLCDGARLDLAYGAIPILRRPEAGPLSFLPPRINSAANGFDMTTNAYFTEDGSHLMVSAGTRPLPIPTAIDTFGCLTTR